MTLYLLDGNPDTFVSVASRYHGVDESLQPDAGVHHHTVEHVLPNEDAALPVVRMTAAGCQRYEPIYSYHLSSCLSRVTIYAYIDQRIESAYGISAFFSYTL